MLKKLVALSLVASLPLVAMADNNEHDEHHEMMEKTHLLEKGVNHIFVGDIKEMPKTNYVGKWLIGKHVVLVDDNTLIIESEELAKKGVEVEVVGKRENGAIRAVELVVED